MLRKTRAFVRTEDVEAVEEGGPIRFVASTEGMKRDGADLRLEDWDMSRYEKHPVVLWGHDLRGENLPIGTGTPHFDDKRRLLIDVHYDQDDPFAMRIRSKAIKRMIAGSVSWDEIKGDDGRTKNQLLEFSNVPVGVDQDALPLRSRMMNDDRQNLIWRGVALAMADLFHPDMDVDDEDRRYLYNGLSRLYGKLGREAPEWRTQAECAAYGAEEYRGLFLEDEPDLLPAIFAEQGEPLPTSALDALRQAEALIQRAINGAEDELEPEPDEMPPTLQAIWDKLQEVAQ